jgi:hypothetical protein
MPPVDAPEAYRRLRRRIRRVGELWRLTRLGEGLLQFSGIVLAAVLLALSLQVILSLNPAVRILLLAGLIALIVGGLWRWVLAPLGERYNESRVAVFIEQRLGNLNNDLINAVQLADDDRPPGRRGPTAARRQFAPLATPGAGRGGLCVSRCRIDRRLSAAICGCRPAVTAPGRLRTATRFDRIAAREAGQHRCAVRR